MSGKCCPASARRYFGPAGRAPLQHAANLSYFAFTATPKHKTLELLGTFDPVGGKYRPFHTYSMRQAIEDRDRDALWAVCQPLARGAA